MTKSKMSIWLILALAVLALVACSAPSVASTNVAGTNPAGTPVEASPATPTMVTQPVATPTRVPTLTPIPTPTAAPPVDPARLGFVVPVKGAHVPEWLDLAPGARRDYRTGTHEGVDFGYDAVGVTVRVGTPVLAAGDGVVVRADLDYREFTPQEMDGVLARSSAQGNTPAGDLDRLRGRQVWIDHGQGVVTRYAHLDRVAPGIATGTHVTKGQLIAYVGKSGIPSEGAGDEPHLHFEIRVGGGYLGQGLPPAKARDLYVQALSGKN